MSFFYVLNSIIAQHGLKGGGYSIEVNTPIGGVSVVEKAMEKYVGTDEKALFSLKLDRKIPL